LLAAASYAFNEVMPGAARHLQLWDLVTGREIRSFSGEIGCFKCIAFAPDGRTIACDEGAKLQIWEVATGLPRHTFSGQSGYISSVAFSPDGHTLAASSPEAPVFLWDVYGRSERHPPPSAD